MILFIATLCCLVSFAIGYVIKDGEIQREINYRETGRQDHTKKCVHFYELKNVLDVDGSVRKLVCKKCGKRTNL